MVHWECADGVLFRGREIFSGSYLPRAWLLSSAEASPLPCQQATGHASHPDHGNSTAVRLPCAAPSLLSLLHGLDACQTRPPLPSPPLNSGCLAAVTCTPSALPALLPLRCTHHARCAGQHTHHRCCCPHRSIHTTPCGTAPRCGSQRAAPCLLHSPVTSHPRRLNPLPQLVCLLPPRAVDRVSSLVACSYCLLRAALSHATMSRGLQMFCLVPLDASRRANPHAASSYLWRCSSGVEQGTHKPRVTGSNPVTATKSPHCISPRMPPLPYPPMFASLPDCHM